MVALTLLRSEVITDSDFLHEARNVGQENIQLAAAPMRLLVYQLPEIPLVEGGHDECESQMCSKEQI